MPSHELSPEHAEMIDRLQKQLLIVLIKRAGGKVTLPVYEIDDTGQDLLSFRIDDNKNFHFTVHKKQ